MGIAAAHFYLFIVGEDGAEASTPFWAPADWPSEAKAPLARFVWFASFGRSR
jgi:hypothetical protein